MAASGRLAPVVTIAAGDRLYVPKGEAVVRWTTNNGAVSTRIVRSFGRKRDPASCRIGRYAALAGGPAALSSAASSSVKTLLRVRNRTPSGASAEKPEPRPGTTSR
jgi:hypothetical protein